VYGPDTQLVTFPGIAVLLAPVAMLSGHLGLSESIAPLFLSTPSSWFLLGPASMLLGSSFLLPFDAIAEEMGASPTRRIVLCWLAAAIGFQVVVLWGHPEDLLAIGLALYGFVTVERERWTLSGWIWGAAIVIQPLSLLLFPLQFVRIPKRLRPKVCCLAALPTLVLVGTPLLSEWRQTSRVMFHQANFPILDHATPWIAFSPHFSASSVGTGPGRILALVVAVGLGIVAWRVRPRALGLIWLCALALCVRCFFEAVMVPFYLGPAFAVVVLAASVWASWPRLLGAWGAAMAATVLAFHHLSEWDYWLPMVGLLALGLICALPGISELRGPAMADGHTASELEHEHNADGGLQPI